VLQVYPYIPPFVRNEVLPVGDPSISFKTPKKFFISHQAHNLVNIGDELNRESQSKTMESRIYPVCERAARCEEGASTAA